VTAPEIHYRAAVAPDGKRGTGTALILQDTGELITYRREASVDRPTHVHHDIVAEPGATSNSRFDRTKSGLRVGVGRADSDPWRRPGKQRC
jgi:hypothetical protein